MAFERAPIFKFDTPDSDGFDKVPAGSMVMIESTSEIFTKNVAGGGTTPAAAIAAGTLTANIDNVNIFNFLYYADEHEDRILGMDTDSMVLAKEIHLTTNAHPGSCDRAAFSDKMYVRSATTVDAIGNNLPVGGRYLEVVDMPAAKKKGTIPMRWKPRSSGAYNRYRDVHAITTKENPWIYLVDCPTDKVIWATGYDTAVGSYNKNEVASTFNSSRWHNNAQGNDGGNATGHAVWLDANHFAMLDRHNVQIEIFKIEGTYPPYTVTSTQTIPTPTGAHSLRSFDGGLFLQDMMFCCAIEGSFGETDDYGNGAIADHSPEMWMMTFDPISGTFDLGNKMVVSFTDDYTAADGAHIAADDNIHHFGTTTWNGRRLVAVPLTRSNRVYLIDLDSQGSGAWTLATDLMPAAGYYKIGGDYSEHYNTFKPGHCEMYNKGGEFRIITTNHGGNSVSVINVNSLTVNEVPIPSLINYTPDGGAFTMSHANHVIGDYYYFFDALGPAGDKNNPDGWFHELDILNEVISRSTHTGGKPVQSKS